MNQFNDEKKREYKEAFDMFDRDKNGLVNIKELSNILRSLGHELTDQDMIDLNDRDKKYEYEDFLNIMGRINKESDIEDELIEAFKIFDKEGNGHIPSSEFKHIMLTLGERLSEDEIDEMIKEADYKDDGYIDYRQFVKILLSR
jgi:Ca2+-binding EF-hand superfamily protein